MSKRPSIACLVAVAIAPFACGAPARDPSQCTASASASASASVSASPIVVDEAVPTSPLAAISRILSAQRAEARWCAPSFLAKIPIEKLRDVIAGMHAAAGGFVSIAPAGEEMTVTFERGRSIARAALDAEGRFTMIWFGPIKPLVASYAESVSRFGSTTGDHALLVTTDGKDRTALDADRPLPVGSTFKLAVLAALRDEVDHAKRRWTDVVRLDAKSRSLPSGTLQTWPDGAPLTLYSLAAAMISVSDNTAADALVHLLGRAAIEPLAPHARPLLTTREMFTLKAKENAALLDRWRAGDEAGKRAVLDLVDARPLPSGVGLLATPTALDVEWYFSARELCALMERVHDLDLTSINPGVASKRDWDAIAYKGGSEAGVLSFTTWVKKGTHAHCISATWRNDAASIDEGAMAAIYGAVLDALAAEDTASATGS